MTAAARAEQAGHTARAEQAELTEKAGQEGLEEAAAKAVREASREGRLASLEDVLAKLDALGFQIPCACPPTTAANTVAHDDNGNIADDAYVRESDQRAPGMQPGGPGSPLDKKAWAWLAGILSSQPGIGCFESLSGRTVYHDPALLSRTYALILDRKGSPVALMAGEIRANSREYPRPVPVELFEAPPFDLTPIEIEHALKTMAASPDFQDITFTTTPSGVAYLFSTTHLERVYAEFLAQRAESLAMNP